MRNLEKTNGFSKSCQDYPQPKSASLPDGSSTFISSFGGTKHQVQVSNTPIHIMNIMNSLFGRTIHNNSDHQTNGNQENGQQPSSSQGTRGSQSGSHTLPSSTSGGNGTHGSGPSSSGGDDPSDPRRPNNNQIGPLGHKGDNQAPSSSPTLQTTSSVPTNRKRTNPSGEGYCFDYLTDAQARYKFQRAVERETGQGIPRGALYIRKYKSQPSVDPKTGPESAKDALMDEERSKKQQTRENHNPNIFNRRRSPPPPGPGNGRGSGMMGRIL